MADAFENAERTKDASNRIRGTRVHWTKVDIFPMTARKVFEDFSE